MGSPSGRLSERVPERFLVATEACGGGTPDLGFVLEVWVYIRGFGVGFTSGGVHESTTRQGDTPSTLVGDSGLFWPNSFASGASSGP